MGMARKLHAHGELLWWLILMLAAALTGMLAREAGGTRALEALVGCPPGGGWVSFSEMSSFPDG